MKRRDGVHSGLPLQARLTKTRLLLHLLTARTPSPQHTGSAMVAGMLVLLALLVGTLGLVAIVNGSNLASLGSGESRDAQQVAEAGADQIIATFNQPENRQLLVAGSTPPNQWSTTNMDLQSPCVSTTNVRPGANGDGMPSARAVNFANGQFRNLENVDQVDQGNRRFVLRSIRYSAGDNGSTDRRAVYRTFDADGTVRSQAGTIPTGTRFNSLLNLDDPDGGGALRPGTHTGYVAVTVEGRLYRPDGTFSTSTITKEFEVLPKCCGGSFGSNASGGSTTGAGAAGDLGADSRFCGIEFGMITGINGGRFLSQAANDRYTKRNTAGQVVNIGAILGIIDNQNYVWDRNTKQVVSNIQVGCRTVPSPCNTSAEIIPGDTSGNTLVTYYQPFTRTTTPNVCPPASLSPLSQALGNEASIEGRAASCIPIVPLFLSAGLPSIASKYTYNWTVGGNPDIVSKQTVTSASPGDYPQINVLAADSNVNIWLRSNGATGVSQVTPGPFLEYCNTRYLPGNACASVFDGSGSDIHTWAVVSRPGPVDGGIRDDFANATYVSSASSTTFTFSGYTAGSTPRWPSLWQASDRDQGGAANLTTGDLIVRSLTGIGRVVTFRDVGANQGTTLTNRPALARAVNLYSLRTPVLEFSFTRSRGSSAANVAALRLDYSFDGTITTDRPVNQSNDTGWTSLASVTADGGVRTQSGTTIGGSNVGFGSNLSNGAVNLSTGTSGRCETTTSAPYSSSNPLYTCRIQLPLAATAATNRFSHFVKFRLRANSDLGTGNSRILEVNLTNVEIKSRNPSSTTVGDATYLNWCEYSAIFPVTTSFSGGFHCLGPTIDLQTLGNNLWVDTTDHSVSFYYNRATDSRGITAADPLINLVRGGTMSNVSCATGRGGGQPPYLNVAPVENCKTLVSENVFNPVAEYDRFNIFGRDTTPANNCIDAGRTNQPCNQVIIIGADSSASAANRSRIAGAWFYLPWGLVSFCVNGCGSLPGLTSAELAQDDSWNFGGRIWVRTILAGGQNHFRVPPSASSSLTQLVGVANSADVSYIGWEGIDWVARSPTAARKGFSLN
ncbi:hypothetical protein VB738_09165 [Cyanobium gracile UHCC 0139]|uniref:Uncharacterized protein n=1 Tax=Cyanobium gracile UHCC 0139 TaxID=3110308 RepID=A0ABU5RUG2_9CYAN|nr:hypothetical protein [Cyanobium gracile]MEA5391427.1 hypothetical protein [Cyanobium gracile UHCC 0139]